MHFRLGAAVSFACVAISTSQGKAKYMTMISGGQNILLH